MGDCLAYLRAFDAGDGTGIFAVMHDKHTPRQVALLQERLPPPEPVPDGATRVQLFKILQLRGENITIAQAKTLTETYKVDANLLPTSEAQAEVLIRAKREARRLAKRPRYCGPSNTELG